MKPALASKARWSRILGQARHASAHPARPAVHLGLPVRRHLPGTRHRRRPGHAGRQYRRHEPTSGRNQQMRQHQCHRPADPRRCWLAQFATTHPAENIVLMPLPSYAPELNSVENNGTICAATFLATSSGTPTSRSSTPVAMPGTPSWQNPTSSPQSEPENGHRSRFKAVGIRRRRARSATSPRVGR